MNFWKNFKTEEKILAVIIIVIALMMLGSIILKWSM